MVELRSSSIKNYKYLISVFAWGKSSTAVKYKTSPSFFKRKIEKLNDWMVKRFWFKISGNLHCKFPLWYNIPLISEIPGISILGSRAIGESITVPLFEGEGGKQTSMW